METTSSLQERFAPGNACFGCGPANDKGLRIRSFPTGVSPEAEVVADWTPETYHEAFDNVLNGGIIGTLMDCHSNWTAIWYMMNRQGVEEAPPMVTADFHVTMRRPTPSTGPIHLSARVVSSEGPRVRVEATLSAGGRVTATCVGHFVAVEPGHPAYYRW
jgi:acyl-coenzyme A thioesterase PaaI-like protein